MKHLVFDASVIIDLWLESDSSNLVKSLFTQKPEGVRFWVAAGSLPIAEALCCQRFKQSGVEPEAAMRRVATQCKDLLEEISILSVYGYDMEKGLETSKSLEYAQISSSVKVLNGEAVIATVDQRHNQQMPVPVKLLKEAMEWMTEAHVKKTVDFIDLKTQQDIVRPQIERKINSVLNHGSYVMGPEIGELEEKLADYVGVKYCIGVSSGTDALLIAMMALEIGPGDEVITTPFTFISTGEMIALLGAKPVFVDIDAKTYNINTRQIDAVITPRTKAIMPVSLYGQCADFDAINQVAEKYGLPVIEDACQSFGATYKGKPSCNLSTMGCTSFFPSKPLGAYGDAGACFTNDDNLAKAIREIRVHGQDRRYFHPRIGVNGRLDTLQAAVLLAKFDVFPAEVDAREGIGRHYTTLIQRAHPIPAFSPIDQGQKDASGLQSSTTVSVVPPYIEPHNTSVYAQYTIQVENRAELLEKLQQQGVPTAVHYPIPLHKQPALETEAVDLPIANLMADRVMSLPMHPYLTKEEQARIIASIAS